MKVFKTTTIYKLNSIAVGVNYDNLLHRGHCVLNEQFLTYSYFKIKSVYFCLIGINYGPMFEIWSFYLCL